jgi:hypothetical protein
MQRYSYSIALRIWHPNITPDLITRALGISPNRSCEAGKPRSTPKGTLLEGTYRESYWNADPFGRGEYSSTDDLVEDALMEVLHLLEPKRDFLLNLRSNGARAGASKLIQWTELCARAGAGAHEPLCGCRGWPCARRVSMCAELVSALTRRSSGRSKTRAANGLALVAFLSLAVWA